MSKYCDDCEFRKKIKFTTSFECKKYNKSLKGNPPEILDGCYMKRDNPHTDGPSKEESTEKGNKRSKKKDFIEVK